MINNNYNKSINLNLKFVIQGVTRMCVVQVLRHSPFPNNAKSSRHFSSPWFTPVTQWRIESSTT